MEAHSQPEGQGAIVEPLNGDKDKRVFEEEARGKLMAGRERMLAQIGKVIVGQREVVDQLLIALFSGGHCLITGAPGLAKTLLIRTIAQILDLEFKRVQFTPDLMPSDITGTEIIDEDRAGHRELRFIQGPVFTNILLADEINRTPPKTQAALLEAMQEHRVTVQGRTYDLPEPFYVFATQNPIELEGTYPLPEAQLDRFMFNIVIAYSSEDEEMDIVRRTTGAPARDTVPVVGAADIVAFQALVRRVPVADPVVRYAVNLVRTTRPGRNGTPDFVTKYLSYGASVRAAQYLILGAKARALLAGRESASFDDVRTLAHAVLRHRLLRNFHAESEKVDADTLVDRLLAAVSVPASGM